MKKHIINYDEKIKMYLLIYLGASALTIIIPAFSITDILNSNLYETFDMSAVYNAIIYTVFPISFLWILLMAYIFFMSVTFKCVTDKDYIRYGTLGLKKVFYKDIESIAFNKHIVLTVKGKKTKIRVLNFEKNEYEYQEILEDIKENTSLEFSVDEAMKQLSYINNFEFAEEGKALRLNGWLFVAFVFSIIYTALMGLYFIFAFFAGIIIMDWTYVLLLLFIGGVFALFLVLTIFMGKRNKNTPKLIRGILIGVLILIGILIVVGIVFSLFVGNILQYNISSSLFIYILSIAGYVSYTLMIVRALKISKRVKYTFVANGNTPVQKYDLDVDPRFKLFAWEPSSIFGVICWIVAPILYVLLYAIIIVVAVASTMMY